MIKHANSRSTYSRSQSLGRVVGILGTGVQAYERHWQEAAEERDGIEAETAERHAEDAKRFGEHLKDITQEYQISYIELDQRLGACQGL